MVRAYPRDKGLRTAWTPDYEPYVAIAADRAGCWLCLS